MKAKALASINHGGKAYHAGDVFDCPAADAAALLAVGKIEEVAAAKPPPASPLRRVRKRVTKEKEA